MPDEPEVQQTETQQTPPDTQPPVVPPEETKPEEETKTHPLEPGGERFNQVYARAKSAEERAKAVEQQLAQEREQRIRFEERERAREEAERKAQQTQGQKRLSQAELDEAVQNGQITQFQALDYAAETRELDRVQRETARRAEQEKVQTAVQRANQGLDRYVEALPGIKDGSHPRWNEVVNTYKTLVLERGYPDSPVTQLTAVEMVFGPVDKIQRRAQMESRANNGHSEGTGGGRLPDNTNKDPYAKIPQRFKEFATRSGMSEEEKKRYFARIPPSSLARP